MSEPPGWRHLAHRWRGRRVAMSEPPGWRRLAHRWRRREEIWTKSGKWGSLCVMQRRHPRTPAPARHECHGAAARGHAGGGGASARDRGHDRRRGASVDRIGLAPGGVRLARRARRQAAAPSNRACGIAGALREPHRRQPSPRDLPGLPCDARRRLRRRVHAVSHRIRRPRLRDRRSRGHLLGLVPRLPSHIHRAEPTEPTEPATHRSTP